ncbi:hypothetical protein L245_24135 [Salmonella enterica subsp. enterica serovar Worthington str. BCH-4719]|nr:hypothetical protein L245_24135 [Salmonella enterica subsp. enterica serovar Worthington str. BCH-4719]
MEEVNSEFTIVVESDLDKYELIDSIMEPQYMGLY